MLTSDKGVAIGFFALSVFLFYGGTLIPQAIYSEGAAGPALFPKLWSIFIAALSVLLYGQSRLREKKEQKTTAQQEPSSRSGEKKVYLTLIAAIAYIALIQPIGFVITTFLFSAATITLLGGEKIKKKVHIVVLVSAAATMITYLLFAQLLNVFLPSGIFM
jgi:putative tricarboxylic transport membrane protein